MKKNKTKIWKCVVCEKEIKTNTKFCSQTCRQRYFMKNASYDMRYYQQLCDKISEKRKHIKELDEIPKSERNEKNYHRKKRAYTAQLINWKLVRDELIKPKPPEEVTKNGTENKTN